MQCLGGFTPSHKRPGMISNCGKGPYINIPYNIPYIDG